MALIPPALDDRSYDDLVQDLLANIPAHTPEWTNPQPGDPGRTLIELFAWLADTILYRANLIPERQRLAFLKLLGQPMQAASPAQGVVSLALDSSALSPVKAVAPATLTGAVPFETLGDIDLLPLTAQAYIKAPLSDAETQDAMPLLSGLQRLYNLGALPAGYHTTPLFTNGLAHAGGIDLMADTTDQSLWLALLVAKPEHLPTVLTAIGGASGQQNLNVGFVPLLSVPPVASVPRQYGSNGAPAPVTATWYLSQPPPADLSQPVGYTTLKVLSDTTAGLTQTGVVQLMLPQGALIGAPSNDVRADGRAGVGLRPPRIDDPAIAARLLTWVRLNVSSALSLSWAGINAVQIDQRQTLQSIVIGVSDGSANQRFALPKTPVDPATFQLDVDMPGVGFQLWQPTDDLGVLQGPVPAFVLDPEAGTVTFGNQLQGMIVPLGRRIRVRRMRAGGGADGNLPAGTLKAIQAFDPAGRQITQTITVQQPIATTGGEDAETLAAAEQRLPSLLRHQDRAVTVRDYRDLVTAMPGAGIGRVEVLPLFKPQTRTPNVPGVVSVMVIPDKDGVQNPCPRADQPMLQSVYQYLSPRTPVTAELYVIASEYVPLAIALAVEVKAGYQMLQVAQAVETALRSYLWPLTGGPDGTGWPLGRSVRSLELDVVASQVAGVVEVNGLELFRPSAGSYQRVAVDAVGNTILDLSSWQLPELLEVLVATGADGSGIQVPPMIPPTQPDNSVAVPVVPNVC